MRINRWQESIWIIQYEEFNIRIISKDSILESFRRIQILRRIQIFRIIIVSNNSNTSNDPNIWIQDSMLLESRSKIGCSECGASWGVFFLKWEHSFICTRKQSPPYCHIALDVQFDMGMRRARWYFVYFWESLPSWLPYNNNINNVIKQSQLQWYYCHIAWTSNPRKEKIMDRES